MTWFSSRAVYSSTKLTPRQSRKFDLTWSADPLYWQNGMAKTGSPLSGVLEVTRALGLDVPDRTHAQRLMLRVASGGRLDHRAGLVPLPGARWPVDAADRE